jgi:hypothetical protein
VTMADGFVETMTKRVILVHHLFLPEGLRILKKITDIRFCNFGQM